ncbi:hypothetical protein Tco_0860237 [Tanacetum coccineum]|uniref:Uncharacterized protein n=1 Tax=Tanacetum coccineum TaxID=301880 RepID=A0ABQ5BEC5_9ASTR
MTTAHNTQLHRPVTVLKQLVHIAMNPVDASRCQKSCVNELQLVSRYLEMVSQKERLCGLEKVFREKSFEK